MLQQKQWQLWNLHQIPNKTSNPDFQFFFQVFSELKKVIVIFIRKSSHIKKKIRQKSKIGIRSFVWNLMQIPKLSLFFSSIVSFWLLFFWTFKNAFYKRGKCIYIYIYIYIHMHILSIIRGFWRYECI